MASSSFLENFYNGTIDWTLPDVLAAGGERSRVVALMEAYRRILDDFPPDEVEKEGRLSEELLKRMAAIGLFGVNLPEIFGGMGFGLREYLTVVREMVKPDLAMAMACLAHLSIGVRAIALFGTDPQKERYLRPAASGEMIFSYALTEPLVGSDAQHIQTKAELAPDGTHYILNGQKTYITNANYAGGLTVFAQLDPQRPGFMGAFIVETAWDGVKIGKDMPKMGLKASSTAAIQFRDVRVPVENMLGSPGDGFKIAMTVLNYGRLGLAEASIGLMEQSLQDMMRRASTRIQFGSAIGAFPLVQEKLVRARVNILVSAAMTELTAALLERDPLANVAMETSHCKLFATTRAWDTLYDALQVAGGSGYLSTQPYEKRLRDFRVTTVFEGTTEIHSMYPALFLLRKWMATFKKNRAGRREQMLFLLKACLPDARRKLPFRHGVPRDAARLVRRAAWTVNRVLAQGVMVYGRKTFEKQFLLRRVTTASLYLYAVMALLLRLEGDQRSGRNDSFASDLLRYFLLEAKEATRRSSRLLPDRRESLHSRIFARLKQGG